MNEFIVDLKNFQTPEIVCNYMASFVFGENPQILEPTPGAGNLVKSLKGKGNIFYPDGDFWKSEYINQGFDFVVMNPPFTPMKEGYNYLYKSMELSDNIIALLPWLSVINSEKRINKMINFGLKSITHLPRKTFPSSRIQCCILELQKGFKGDILFKNFTW